MYTSIKALFSCGRFKKPSHQTRLRPNQTLIGTTNSPEHNPITIYNSHSFDLYTRFSMAELTAATNNFSPDLIIGSGRFRYIYKGQLSNGVVVAVKKLKPCEFQEFREFRAEMETQGKLCHRNILPLFGYCESGDDRLLVFKFMEKGNLYQWLHDRSSAQYISHTLFPLSWETRIKIIRGVANELSYLHGLEKSIVHRNISASNILLDHEFEAQISQFGLARRIQPSYSQSTDVAGTMGYLPPEYRNSSSGKVTVKADVYGFGVLMLEIATGWWPSLFREVDIVDWAINMVAQNSQMQMVDPKISRKGLIEASVVEYFRIACMCITESPRERPVMTEIVHLLNQILL
ncbi:Receptor-like kinase [Quillaja saponaria]|uniref:Receptor-like kinase n=1 Tax=Quillaja saponaria TaxID=32244 RepID=A0AAD7PC12_QUISA|nr:Receptor-like kinase [Quillaja saponaria]